MLKLSDAIKRVRYQLLEEYPGYWSDNEITDYLNEGNRVFHTNRGIPTIATLNIPDDTTVVAKDASIINFDSISYTDSNGNTAILPETSYQINRAFITFNPALNEGKLTWYGERIPKTVVNSDDYFEINPAFEQAIIDYATYKAMIKDNDARSSAYYSNFLNAKMHWENYRFVKNHRIQIEVR